MSKITKPLHFRESATMQELGAQYVLVNDLYGGTEAMRDAGTLYLPKEPMESARNYKDRLGRSTLTPVYKRTIKKAVGKAFSRPMTVTGPSALDPLKDNADGAGTSLETFAKQLLDDAINYGITYILVDYPRMGDVANLAQERASGAFPYFVEIKPTQVLDLRVDYINNKAQVVYFRFYESLMDYDSDGVTQIAVEQAKEIFLGDDGNVYFNTYRKKAAGQEEIVESGQIVGLNVIPIVPVYGNKTQPFMGTPTLIDLAYMSVKHWQKQSDLDWNEHFGLTPMLALKGLENKADPETGKKDTDAFAVSASMVINLPTDGDIKWVTADATGIKAGQDSLDRLLREMSEAGLELTSAQTTGAETATGRIIDASESNSILKGIVLDLEWSLYNAMLIAGEYIGVNATDTEIKLDTTYTVFNQTDMTFLLELHKAGIITDEEIREELKTRKTFLSEKVDAGLDKPIVKPEPVVTQPVLPTPEVTPTPTPEQD